MHHLSISDIEIKGIRVEKYTALNTMSTSIVPCLTSSLLQSGGASVLVMLVVPMVPVMKPMAPFWGTVAVPMIMVTPCGHSLLISS